MWARPACGQLDNSHINCLHAGKNTGVFQREHDISQSVKHCQQARNEGTINTGHLQHNRANFWKNVERKRLNSVLLHTQG
jgi:hypothetical protein